MDLEEEEDVDSRAVRSSSCSKSKSKCGSVWSPWPLRLSAEFVLTGKGVCRTEGLVGARRADGEELDDEGWGGCGLGAG